MNALLPLNWITVRSIIKEIMIYVKRVFCKNHKQLNSTARIEQCIDRLKLFLQSEIPSNLCQLLELEMDISPFNLF